MCPHCGLNIRKPSTNYTKDILIILNSFNDITKQEIDRVRIAINQNRKELKFRQDILYKFLVRIKKVPEDIIIDSISVFMDKELYLTKEYSYLFAIIKNNIIVRDRRIDEEIMKHGRVPELEGWQ